MSAHRERWMLPFLICGAAGGWSCSGQQPDNSAPTARAVSSPSSSPVKSASASPSSTDAAASPPLDDAFFAGFVGRYKTREGLPSVVLSPPPATSPIIAVSPIGTLASPKATKGAKDASAKRAQVVTSEPAASSDPFGLVADEPKATSATSAGGDPSEAAEWPRASCVVAPLDCTPKPPGKTDLFTGLQHFANAIAAEMCSKPLIKSNPGVSAAELRRCNVLVRDNLEVEGAEYRAWVIRLNPRFFEDVARTRLLVSLSEPKFLDMMYAILAHEYGHHLEHRLGGFWRAEHNQFLARIPDFEKMSDGKKEELYADATAACTVSRTFFGDTREGRNRKDTLEVFVQFLSLFGGGCPTTHPDVTQRLHALDIGWKSERCNGEKVDPEIIVKLAESLGHRI